MVVHLLSKIINQRVKPCRTSLREILGGDIPEGEPLPVVLGPYALSLVKWNVFLFFSLGQILINY
jgi:hypothetical protein